MEETARPGLHLPPWTVAPDIDFPSYSGRSPYGTGVAPSRSMPGVALLLIDVINPLDFDGGDVLLARALPAARRIATLRQRAHEAGVPTVYVNDNFDRWHLGLRELVEAFRADDVRGRPLIDILEPDLGRDHFILKPMHSGFFRTPLEVLLQRLGTRTLVLTGFAADICVFFTADDAYMRGFRIAVPADCTAAERDEDAAQALRQLARISKADLRPSADIDFAALGRDR